MQSDESPQIQNMRSISFHMRNGQNMAAMSEMSAMIEAPLQSFDQSLFLDRNEANTYLCTICQFICNNPVTAECGNGHIYCKLCIQKHLVHSKQCPNCQKTIHSLHDAKFIDRLIQQLQVHCISLLTSYIEPYSARTSLCDWTGPLSEAQAHYDSHCAFTLCRCPKCGMNPCTLSLGVTE